MDIDGLPLPIEQVPVPDHVHTQRNHRVAPVQLHYVLWPRTREHYSACVSVGVALQLFGRHCPRGRHSPAPISILNIHQCHSSPQFRAVLTMTHRRKFEKFCEDFLSLFDSIRVSYTGRLNVLTSFLNGHYYLLISGLWRSQFRGYPTSDDQTGRSVHQVQLLLRLLHCDHVLHLSLVHIG